MQGTTIDRTSDSTALPDGIRIDGVRLLTGTLGFGFLIISWTCAFDALLMAVLGAYFAIVGKGFEAALMLAEVTLFALTWSMTRWIARGLLEGGKARAIIACILMTGLALIGLWSIFGESSILRGSPTLEQSGPANVSAIVVLALIWLVLSFLLIASFRNRLYWRRVR